MHQQNGIPSKAPLASSISSSSAPVRLADEEQRVMNTSASQPHHQRNQNYPPLAHDRAISSINQRICGIMALQVGFHTSSLSALTRLSDLALARKFSLFQI